MILAIELFVLASLWVSAILCLPSALRGKRLLVFWFLFAFAVTMTPQPLPIYLAVDSLLGGINTTSFIFHATAIITIALIDTLVQSATSKDGLSRRRNLISASVTTGIIALQAVLFFGGEWRFNTVREALPQVDFILYSSTTWLALGFFSVSVAAACLRDIAQQTRTITKVSLSFIALGCLGVLVFAVVSLTGAGLGFANHESTFSQDAHGLYLASLFMAPLSLAIGAGLTSAVDGIITLGRNARSRSLLLRLTPLWIGLMADTPELSLDSANSRAASLFGKDPTPRLYRRYVEVRDSLLVHPQQITARNEQILRAAENHIAAQSSTSPSRAVPAS
ncbi:DUF6545 domain-containing protein [Cryobacterium psychrophilum]|uniref:DUF6545 domain-containing protein n=1 Tax=Cryobacterium psychrophilum TaxID=41988 RepID=A0A4Y8KRW4_9MICO|nr:DUF6545 domain-containing protein [Cryobacterium psychrophilum]TDW28696.1 hypothetical protein EDD25_0323 [Cryobacterium psychrophilum]TFD82354.1 hypothetical protein E3T53_00290 [Cryobacterium psychrophilum]